MEDKKIKKPIKIEEQQERKNEEQKEEQDKEQEETETQKEEQNKEQEETETQKEEQNKEQEETETQQEEQNKEENQQSGKDEVKEKINTTTEQKVVSISTNIDENIKFIEDKLKDCDDLVKRKFYIGKNQSIPMYIMYADVMVDRRVIEESVMEQLTDYSYDVDFSEFKDKEKVFNFIKENGLATADMKEETDANKAIMSVLSGDTILFIDGYDKCFVVMTKGWPNRGIQATEIEVDVRGPREGFTEAFRMNTVLIRRRIRDANLKVKQFKLGRRSNTDVGLVYLEDVVRQDILEDVKNRLSKIDIDAILESGYIEQLIEDDWKSSFPQVQTTERPDRVAAAILEGRIAIVVDTTPFVLIVPTTLNCFFQAAEDYYQRWQVMTLTRWVRYVAAIFAVALPGFYIALTTFQPAMIPTTLAVAIASSREGVPFPVAIEVIIMEFSFELLREAGIRLPGPIGSTIGIVGGLIIGQAAVQASLVSPVIVIIVAITAISSFAIPDNALGVAARISKYLIIILSIFLGIYGFLLGIFIVLSHLVSLKSFNIPYLYPYVSSTPVSSSDIKDSIIRMPIFSMLKRPIFANPLQKVRQKSIFKK